MPDRPAPHSPPLKNVGQVLNLRPIFNRPAEGKRMPSPWFKPACLVTAALCQPILAAPAFPADCTGCPVRGGAARKPQDCLPYKFAPAPEEAKI